MPVDRRLLLSLPLTGLVQTRPGARPRRPAMRGFNLIETPTAPLGGAAADLSIRRAASVGANTIALVPFLWQSRPDDADIVWGDALSPDRLAAGLRQLRRAGLRAVVKVHVWVPGGWAGQVAMSDDTAWVRWFERYEDILARLTRIARDERADALILGTELRGAAERPEWRRLISRVRSDFAGRLSYVAHGADEAERIPFWRDLDAVGASLYPALGPGDRTDAWAEAMARETRRLQAICRRENRPLWIGEIGLRSAAGATERPWESAEERLAEPDPTLQAEVIAAWLRALDQARPNMTLIWRWFSDPTAGGPADTDFTVQNKAAETRLRTLWS